MARQSRRPPSPAQVTAPPPEAHPEHAAGDRPSAGRVRVPLLMLAVLAGVGLPALRLWGVIDWDWGAVLAPFTAAGLAAGLGILFYLYREPLHTLRISMFGGSRPPAGATPPPDRLDPPQAAVEAGDPILAEHPEILAALCHGFRVKRVLPVILGQPVTDPWGLYRVAVTAPPEDIQMLRLVASSHTKLQAKAHRKDGGRVSDAVAMRAAVDAFRPCAQKAEAGRGHPDCPFEHVTAVFGADSPNRDMHLRALAPKVRALLERQYPHLETARLADGSHVKFVDWQRRAAQDRAELSKLRKDLDRQVRTVEELRGQLAAAESRAQALTDAAERHRRAALEAARAGQERVVGDLRASLDRLAHEQARERQRHDADVARLVATQDALTAERDGLEQALLAAATPEETPLESPVDLTGIRVLLVGGESRQLGPLRDRLAAHGAQLLHDDGVAAGEHVGRVHVVVFWIRYLSHPTYFGVRQKVRALKAPHAYWMRTSPESLIALVARTIDQNPQPPAD